MRARVSPPPISINLECVKQFEHLRIVGRIEIVEQGLPRVWCMRVEHLAKLRVVVREILKFTAGEGGQCRQGCVGHHVGARKHVRVTRTQIGKNLTQRLRGAVVGTV